MVQKDYKGGGAYAKRGLKYIEGIAEPNDEEYAMLGSLYSLSITFNPAEAIGLSTKARKSFNKALKQNPENLRALLDIGRADFYKPKQYGGGGILPILGRAVGDFYGSIDFDAADYLVKSISFERFVRAVQKVQQSREVALATEVTPITEDHIFIKSDGQIIKIPVSSIVYAESAKEIRSIA